MKVVQVGVSDVVEVYICKFEVVKVVMYGLGLKSVVVWQELGILIGEVMCGNFGVLCGFGIMLVNWVGWIDQLLLLCGFGIVGMVGGIVVVVYGLGKVWYDGSKEFEEFNRQLILIGNYVGKMFGQLQVLVCLLVGNGIIQYVVVGVLVQVVGSGVFSGNDVSMVSNVVVRLQQVIGQVVDEIINQFKCLKDDLVNVVIMFNDLLYFLMVMQYEQIVFVQVMGDMQKVLEFVMCVYFDVVIQWVGVVEENFGFFEKVWNWVKNVVLGVWDVMLGIGCNFDIVMKCQDFFVEWQVVEKEYCVLFGNFKVDLDYVGNNVL